MVADSAHRYHDRRNAVAPTERWGASGSSYASKPSVVRAQTTYASNCNDAVVLYDASGEADAWRRDRLRERSAPFGTEFDREGSELAVGLGD